MAEKPRAYTVAQLRARLGELATGHSRRDVAELLGLNGTSREAADAYAAVLHMAEGLERLGPDQLDKLLAEPE